jgi:hypothetical protein
MDPVPRSLFDESSKKLEVRSATAWILFKVIKKSLKVRLANQSQ